MHYTDTHIHLQDYNPADIKNVVTKTQKNNVTAFVNASSHPLDWQKVIDLSQTYSQITPALGVHPWFADNAPSDWAKQLEKELQKNASVWLGECGLDRLKNPNTQKQLQILQTHVELAHKYNRPLIMHAVKADAILYPLLSQLPQKTIFHSFTGSAEWGLELQKRGFYLGLNFSILHKKNYVRILERLNPHFLLLETDGPYQSGEKNTPSLPQNLPTLASTLANIFNLSALDFSQILYQNWLALTGE